MSVGELESGNVEPPADSARAEDESLRLQPHPGRRFDRLRVDEPRDAGVLVYSHAQRIDLLTPCRMGTHVVDDLADAREQARVIEYRLAHRNTILSELACLAHQSRRVSQRPDWNGTVIGCHSAKLVASDKRCLSTQVRGAQRRHDSGRSRANNDDIDHFELASIPWPKSRDFTLDSFAPN